MCVNAQVNCINRARLTHKRTLAWPHKKTNGLVREDRMRSKFSAMAVASVLAIAVSGAAHGQEIGSDQSVQPDDVQPDEILVTAQKRQERLQDVPVAITAISGASLESGAVAQLDDLAQLTPGLIVGSFTPAKPIVYIRGVGTRQIGIGTDPSVGVFIDDQYVGQVSGFLTGLADIERVEVLKGPQGTLYGRNTIAGVISVVTRKPSHDPEASIEAGLTNRAGRFLRGSASGPIAGDKLRARISVFSSKRDGYMENLVTGARAQGEDQTGLRARVIFDATDQLSFEVFASTLRDTAPAQLGKNAGPLLFFRNPLIALPAPSPSRYSDRYNVDSENDRQISSLALRADWSGDNLSVTSISSFRNSRLDAFEDVDNTILDVETQRERERVSEYSQEIRLTSEKTGSLSFNGHVDWVFGAYLYHDKARRSDIFEWGSDSFPVFFSQLPAALTGYTGGPVSRVATGGELSRTTDSLAFFGQTRIAPTSKLGLTLGLRYTHERKQGVYMGTTNAVGVPPILAPFESDVGRSWESLDPRITLDYHFAPDVMAYASFSRGFKSGGFQFVVVDKSLSDIMFNPERVSAYEVGLRSELFDRRIKLNLTAFHYDYSDLQLLRLLATTGGASTIVDNVASSKIDGLELEAQWRAAPGLSIGANYAYLDARFQNYAYATGQDFAGTPLPRSPKHSLSVFGDLQLTLPGDFDFGLRADWSYSSSFSHEPGGFGTKGNATSLNPALIEPAHSVVNLRASIGKGNWRLTAFADNLFNEPVRAAVQDYPAIVTPFGDIGSQTADFWAAPRSYGASLQFKFR